LLLGPIGLWQTETALRESGVPSLADVTKGGEIDHPPGMQLRISAPLFIPSIPVIGVRLCGAAG